MLSTEQIKDAVERAGARLYSLKFSEPGSRDAVRLTLVARAMLNHNGELGDAERSQLHYDVDAWLADAVRWRPHSFDEVLAGLPEFLAAVAETETDERRDFARCNDLLPRVRRQCAARLACALSRDRTERVRLIGHLTSLRRANYLRQRVGA